MGRKGAVHTKRYDIGPIGRNRKERQKPYLFEHPISLKTGSFCKGILTFMYNLHVIIYT